MRQVQPMIFDVGETRANGAGIRAYLKEIGAPDWVSKDCKTDAEGLIELFGRGCYRSFEPGMNPNLMKVREGNTEYIGNIVKQGHGSVFEHTYVNFIFLYVSRVFTHELVRHRVGVGISQESLRFVRLDELDFWIPPDIEENPEAKRIFIEAIAAGEAWQKELAEVLGLDDPDVPFEKKKQLTSAMRRIAPEGLATMIGWTANFRVARHVIEQRTAPHAEREIRMVFAMVAENLTWRFPAVFADYETEIVDGLPWYRTAYSKV